MNSRQRRKARREEERFIATPEGSQLVKTLDEFHEYVAGYRRQRTSTGWPFNSRMQNVAKGGR
jgi:acetylornithine deacetylase/succinyl-diaminopimelate desuccinylase-like protein